MRDFFLSSLVVIVFLGCTIPSVRAERLLKQELDAEEDSCLSGPLTDYKQGLHIGAIFIIMGTSALGSFFSMLIRSFPNFKLGKDIIAVGKHFGTGVILATGFIHMFPGAMESLSNPCIGEFGEVYEAWAGLFAMLSALALLMIEYGASVIYEKYQARRGADSAEFHFSDESSADLEKNKSPEMSGCHHHHGGLLEGETIDRTISTCLLEFGIALHSVLIGVAVGVASGSEFSSLLIAVVFHQFFEGLALGARVEDLNIKSRAFAYASSLLYTLITPTGVAIGVGIHSTYNPHGATALLVNGVFDSVSAGILFYMAFVELMSTDYHNNPVFMRSSVTLKGACFLALWCGAAVMAVIGIWA
ncbi:ZIP zinc/iron transport family, partial [Basidiobolus meristosporus CBS 931.73]|uniref:ZIP zinc/iron transport family n=1 Tax=Basidiobolus meristosporus CBS 931.73 TaxID=1314790 RepID=A0A1Y1W2C7_9FUNG|eukprot:ORX67700.1 ZIP zinc/iron transport family [Basidiobolus meristosporus CBS 931.73]